MVSSRVLSSGLVLALALAAPFAAGCSGSAVEQPAATTTSGLTTGPLSVTVHGRAKAVADGQPVRASHVRGVRAVPRLPDGECYRFQAGQRGKKRPIRVSALADAADAGRVNANPLQVGDGGASRWRQTS